MSNNEAGFFSEPRNDNITGHYCQAIASHTKWQYPPLQRTHFETYKQRMDLSFPHTRRIKKDRPQLYKFS